jgi:hypothetical protein
MFHFGYLCSRQVLQPLVANASLMGLMRGRLGRYPVALVLVLAVVRLWPRYSIGVSGAGVAAAATRAVGAEWALLPRED